MILECLKFLRPLTFLVWNGTRDWNKMQVHLPPLFAHNVVPFGVTYEKIGEKGSFARHDFYTEFRGAKLGRDFLTRQFQFCALE
jgi:hypothetical protein